MGEAVTAVVEFVSEPPMTGIGKVDKKVLKAGFWAGRDRMVVSPGGWGAPPRPHGGMNYRFSTTRLWTARPK
jgi:hypothetical protein